MPVRDLYFGDAIHRLGTRGVVIPCLLDAFASDCAPFPPRAVQAIHGVGGQTDGPYLDRSPRNSGWWMAFGQLQDRRTNDQNERSWSYATHQHELVAKDRRPSGKEETGVGEHRIDSDRQEWSHLPWRKRSSDRRTAYNEDPTSIHTGRDGASWFRASNEIEGIYPDHVLLFVLGSAHVLDLGVFRSGPGQAAARGSPHHALVCSLRSDTSVC